MKCPFCHQELVKDPDGYYTCYTDNCGCWAHGGNGASGSESLWLTLICTLKALDAAKKRLMQIGYLNMSDHGLGSEKMMTDWCKTVALHGLNEIETTLKTKG